MNADFAIRLHSVCDMHPLVPVMNMGRLTWIKDELKKKHDLDVSVETVRKWFSGESKPRPDKLALLAELLQVDQGWLSLGLSADLTPRERKLRDASVDGSVNLVAGFLQLQGLAPAFPSETDAQAQAGHVDIQVVIKGAHYSLHVALSMPTATGHRFSVPAKHNLATQIGVIPGPDLSARIIEIPEETISAGVNRGAMIDVEIPEAEIEGLRIKTFAKRL